MQHFYDGQIRRYITQTIRVFSNFVVKYGDGSLHRIPVMYGDPDRQVASIIRGNSENKVNSVPRIAVYVTALDMDKDRLADSTHVSKVNIRERDIITGEYTQSQGKNYTVERLMPTPFKLTMKVDIWTANTDQKLQVMEQLLVLFNPSLELQTSSNYVDWTALTVLNLAQINWSSRAVPVGAESTIDIASLTVDTPIWISPPAKVKHMGVITKIITSMFNTASVSDGYVEGLGGDSAGDSVTLTDLLSTEVTTLGGFNIEIFNTGESFKAQLIKFSGDAKLPQNWDALFEPYPGQYVAGSSTIYVTQIDGSEISGTVSVDPLNNTLLNVSPNPDMLTQDETILDTNPISGYISQRTGSPSTFDAIINPTTVYPGHGMINPEPGDRFLIIEDVVTGTEAWGNFAASANDIIEYGADDQWHVLFDAVQEQRIIIQANIYNGIRVQYVWNNVSWTKRFDGEYKASQWRIVL